MTATLIFERSAGITDFPSASVLRFVSNFSAFAKQIWSLQKFKRATLQDTDTRVRERNDNLAVGKDPFHPSQFRHALNRAQESLAKRQNQNKTCQIHHPFSLSTLPKPFLSQTITPD